LKMEEPESDRNLGLLMYDVARLMRANFHRRVQPLGLTQAQWRTLFHLARNEGLNQGALAEILEIQPITLARLVDRLEAAGWAERRPDPADRRAFQLYVTAKARPVLEQIKELATETREEAMQGLSQTEREQLLDLLSALKGNLLATETNASQARADRLDRRPVSEPDSRKRKHRYG
jgi:DNA-binding MarR family transcriptional regulator